MKGRTALPSAGECAQLPRRTALPLALGTLLQPLNSSTLAVALTGVRAHFHAGSGAVTWLVSGFFIAAAVSSPVMGRLADLLGPRRISLAGLIVVVAVSAVAPFAPSIQLLILARVLLGIATAAQFPAAVAILMQASVRARAQSSGALAVLSISSQVTVAAGPAVGGLFGWQGSFWTNIPIAALATGALLAWAPADRESLRSHRAAQPFVDPRLLRNRPLLLGYLRTVVTAIAFYSLLYGFPRWLVHTRGLAPSTAGLVMLPVAVLGVASTVLAARLQRRNANRTTLLVGTAGLTLSGTLLIFPTATTPPFFLLIISALLGLPNGFNNLANQGAIYRAAPADLAGAATGFYRTAQYLGASLAAVLLESTTATGGDLSELGLLVTIISGALLLATRLPSAGL